MPGRQRILVVSTTAGEAELTRVRSDLGRHPLLITAPTVDAEQVVRSLSVVPRVEQLLAPAAFPPADRGHQLDVLVRRHALEDRYRDVVVVTDPATATLLLRSLAPDQLAASGAVTVVGLPRGERPISAPRAIIGGLVLGLAASVVLLLGSILTLPVIAALIGLVLLAVPSARHVGRELLLAAAVALTFALAIAAGSARFPGGF